MSVMLRARLHGAGADRDAWIVDLSSHGLSATADHPPRQGDQVELVVGDIVLTGHVKWVRMRRFGMQFRERISVGGLLSGEDRVPGPAANPGEDREPDRGLSLFSKAESALLFGGGAAAALVIMLFVGRSL